MRAKVSVIIPTHSRKEMLNRAIQSVLNQTYPNIEIVVVDDASTDDTPQFVQQLKEEKSNILYLRNDVSQGACGARNRGIAEASGKYIALLDDDDEYLPTALTELVGAYERGGYSFVCADLKIINKKGNRISSKPGVIDLEKILWINNATMCMVSEREKVQAVGAFDEALFAAQDYDLWVRLIHDFGPAKRLDKVLYIYHQEHEAVRITTVSSKRFKGYFDNYQKHKPLMTRPQRAYQLYRLWKLTGHRVTINQFFKMVPRQYYLLELNDLIMEKTNIYLFLTKLKKIFYKSAH